MNTPKLIECYRNVKHFKKHLLGKTYLHYDDTDATKKMNFVAYFHEYINLPEDDKFPLLWRQYWLYKNHVFGYKDTTFQSSRTYLEYEMVTTLIESYENGHIPLPEFFIDKIPDVKLIPKFIPCSIANNERKNDFVYQLEFEFWPEYKSTYDNPGFSDLIADIILWHIENIHGEFYLTSHSTRIIIRYTDKNDTMLAKLVYGDKIVPYESYPLPKNT